MGSSLIAKIAAASKKVGALKTDKRNLQQQYDYISADKILERAGDALSDAGVVIVPAITVENTEKVTTDKGGSRYDSIVHFMMTLTDGEGQLEMAWCGRGSDYAVPDKALYKAITSGHKYFLMKLLNIGVGNEDGEHENGEEQPAALTPPTKPVTPKPTAKAAASETAKHREPPQQQRNNDGDGPSTFESSIIEKWRGPVDAQMWATNSGSCANDFEARNSWVNTVKEMGGYPGKDKQIVFLAFLRKHTERMAMAA